MNLSLENRLAVVCGSTQGIGRASAHELASLGATIICLARNEESLQEVVGALPADYGQSHAYFVADFSTPDEVKAVAEKIADQYGKCDVLVNNTGGPPAGPALGAKPEDFLAAFNLHLISNHHLVQTLAPLMKKQVYGRIINVISTSVKIPIPGLGVSNTIRGAVANWSKTLSIELGCYGITVNNVLPGATSTQRLDSIIANKAAKSGKSTEEVEDEMHAEIPARRFAKPEETAAAIAFLASPAASYINGINLPVDGGRTGAL